jgi:hypothetical protein
MQASQPPRRLPEFKALVEAARSHVAGNSHFSNVCSAASAFNEATKVYAVDPRVRKIASEWVEMASRAWSEWGQVENPITPEEYKEWVQLQLSVFDAMEQQD